MSHSNLDDTQPTPVIKKEAQRGEGKPVSPSSTDTRRHLRRFAAMAWFIGALVIVMVIGAVVGAASGREALQRGDAQTRQQALQEQYALAVQDLEAGRLTLAIQRFEYILNQDPSFPGVTEKMAQALQALYLTSTPPPQPTPTLTPTPDMRPIEEMFADAENRLRAKDWDGALQVLSTLRKTDATFHTTRVDGMMFLALRYRGLEKILNAGALESGLYDFSLAERFGPLDSEAQAARQWAQLYVYGLAFWEVDPEKAVYYFGQLVQLAPYLHDVSGWTARDRYVEALVQYGDLLAEKGDWCAAMSQYEMALSIQPSESLQGKYEQAAKECEGPSPTPTSEAGTATATATSVGVTETASPTPPPGETPTPTPSETPSPASPTPMPTETFTLPPPLPTESPTPYPLAAMIHEEAGALRGVLPSGYISLSFLTFLFLLWKRVQ